MEMCKGSLCAGGAEAGAAGEGTSRAKERQVSCAGASAGGEILSILTWLGLPELLKAGGSCLLAWGSHKVMILFFGTVQAEVKLSGT